MALDRIEVMANLDNVASPRLLERLGFLKEGLLRDYYFQNGRYYDHWLLALLKMDWMKRER